LQAFLHLDNLCNINKKLTAHHQKNAVSYRVEAKTVPSFKNKEFKHLMEDMLLFKSSIAVRKGDILYH
jgi:hypothetical protein